MCDGPSGLKTTPASRRPRGAAPAQLETTLMASRVDCCLLGGGGGDELCQEGRALFDGVSADREHLRLIVLRAAVRTLSNYNVVIW